MYMADNMILIRINLMKVRVFGGNRLNICVLGFEIKCISYTLAYPLSPSLYRCFSEEGCLSLRQLEGYLVVLQPDAPQISLSGVGPHLARPAPEFEAARGVPLFPELRIACSLSHAVNTAAQDMEGGGEETQHLKNFPQNPSQFFSLNHYAKHLR